MYTIDHFEQMIEAKILDRGKDYYQQNLILEFDYEDDRCWAVVEGSYDYEVEITLEGQQIIEAFCDCPYDYGPYCKHIAAVLYKLRDHMRPIITTPGKSAKAKPSKKQKVRDVVESLTREQLIDIVMEQVKADRTLGNTLLLRYGAGKPDKSLYSKTISDWVRQASDHGFIDYRSSQKVGRLVYGLLDEAQKAIQDEKPERAIPVVQAVIEEMSLALQSADDSSGEMSGSVESAFHILEETLPNISEDEKRSLYNYCLDQAMDDNHRRLGLGYDWDFVEIAGQLITNEADKNTLFAIIDDKVASLTGGFTRYQKERAVFIKKQIMADNGATSEDIQALLRQHIHLHGVRQMLIEQAIAEKHYEEARSLATDGIIQAEAERYPGLVNQYRENLLDIAKKTGDSSDILKMAERLFFESNRGMQYYADLRELVPKKDWPEFVQQIIDKLKAERNSWRTPRLLVDVYEQEEMWAELFQLAKETQNLSIIDHYKQKLDPLYPEAISEIYERKVYAMLEQASGRDTYKGAVAYLRRIMEVDTEERALEIVDFLKEMYPNRRAMIQELDRL